MDKICLRHGFWSARVSVDRPAYVGCPYGQCISVMCRGEKGWFSIIPSSGLASFDASFHMRIVVDSRLRETRVRRIFCFDSRNDV